MSPEEKILVECPRCASLYDVGRRELESGKILRCARCGVRWLNAETGDAAMRRKGMMNNKRTAFTLVELLVVVSIIALLISILLPSLGSARRQSKSALCLSNLRSMAQITHMYLTDNRDIFPVRSSTSSTGGGSVFGAFEPSRIILKYDKRPIDILTCPLDSSEVRDYPVGDEPGTNPDSLGIGTFYNLAPEKIIRYSYGLNNMTGLRPVTDSEKLIFSPKLGDYRFTGRTLLYADCAWINARGHNTSVNDAPKLKGRIANSAAPHRMNRLAEIPEELGTPQPKYRRHPGGNNVLFMDYHGEPISQADAFNPAKLIYSWSER